MLPRVHWFEFNELSWVPDGIKHAVTRSITFDMWVYGCFRGQLPEHFHRWMDRAGAREVLDIGSGSAGPVLSLIRNLRRRGLEPPRFHLSDIRPDLAHFAELAAKSPVCGDVPGRYIDYVPEPLDALADPLATDHEHFTLCNVTHHFPPDTLRRLLTNLLRQGRGVFIIETFYRSIRFVPILLGSLVPSVVAPLLLRPFSWTHFLLGTLVPVVPLLMMHDGFATVLRCYNPDEWRRIVDELPVEGYEWEIGRLRTGTVYIAGWKP